MTRWLGLFLILCCSCRFATAAELDTRLHAIFQRLQKASAQIESVESDFTQEKVLAMFSRTLRSQGRLAFQRERHLRWEIVKPTASGFVINGDQGRRWHALQDKDETFNLADEPLIAAITEQLLAWFRADFASLQRQYRIEPIAANPIHLRLYPNQTGLFRHIDIQFASDDRSIARVELVEQDGDRTRLLFANTRINSPLDPALFH